MTLAAAVALGLGACGNSQVPLANSETPTKAPSPTPSKKIDPRDVLPPVKTPPAGQKTPGPEDIVMATVLPTAIPSIKQPPLSVKLGSECVRPGGVQTLEIKTTKKFTYSYATLWPDNGTHKEWKAYGYGEVPSNGRVLATWNIPVNAPQGRARTDLAVAGQIDEEQYAGLRHPLWKIDKDC